MTTTPATIASPAGQRKPLARALLLLPPAVLTVTAVVLVLVSPFAWDAADVIDIPGWMPVVVGLLAGVIALVVAGYSFARTLRETRGDFEVFPLQLAFGVIMFISGAAMLGSLVLQIGDEGFYAGRFLDEDEEPISSLGLFVISMLYLAWNIGWVWVGAYLYSHAIANMQPNAISARQPGEVDGVGALLQERQ